ncbi:MAG: methyltransferase domain-containing protein [Planctomycetota bacterium]|jgi:SAM-dependent methyltransferase
MQAQNSKEAAVLARYSQGAQACEESLCSPVSYDRAHLAVLPDEILQRDYGCGDPTPFVRPGDTVLDLGSGAGKVCWIAAQMVGPQGKVIGVDMNTDMVALARKYHQAIAAKVGYDNVAYRRGMIQDLKLDLGLLEEELQRNPVAGAEAWLQLRQKEDELRRDRPMIADESVDLILSNCVLNLVRPADKPQLFQEMYRVTKRGGRVAISDIVADEDVPQEMQDDPELWSGCISGAYREDLFLEAFQEAGFHGIEIVSRGEKPWRTVNGIEFRAVIVQAFKGKEGPCLERNQALVYRGPFRKVHDDDGHAFVRGQRMAVCDKTFHLLQKEPYAEMFLPVEPLTEIPLEAAGEFNCRASAVRNPRETKGKDYNANTNGSPSCC